MSGVTLTGQLRCSSAEEAALVAAYLPLHVELTRVEPGCVSFHVDQTADPLVWQVSERFVDRAAFEAHQVRVAESAWGRRTTGIERQYVVSESGADIR